MADMNNPLAMIQAQLMENQRQMAALRQAPPAQGGILSNADPVMLSLAAGLLSPTKTGGFGESIGKGLEAAQSPLADIRRQEAARLDKLSALQNAQTKLAMDLYEIQTGRRGARSDDASLIAFRYENMADKALNAAKLVGPEDPEYEGLMDKYQHYTNLAKAVSGKKTKAEGDVEGDAEGDVAADVGTEQKNSGAIPQVKTKQEYDALPSGTRYIDPNGVPRTKAGTVSE